MIDQVVREGRWYQFSRMWKDKAAYLEMAGRRQ